MGHQSRAAHYATTKHDLYVHESVHNRVACSAFHVHLPTCKCICMCQDRVVAATAQASNATRMPRAGWVCNGSYGAKAHLSTDDCGLRAGDSTTTHIPPQIPPTSPPAAAATAAAAAVRSTHHCLRRQGHRSQRIGMRPERRDSLRAQRTALPSHPPTSSQWRRLAAWR
jgi:hypothetical protein